MSRSRRWTECGLPIMTVANKRASGLLLPTIGRQPSLASILAGLGLVIMLAVVPEAIPVSVAYDGTLVVTNTNDGGPGSLRQAIADAAPGNTIEFTLTYPATITLTTGELAIAKSLTIAGPGRNLLAVSGNDASRVFRVDKPGGANQIEVAISALTIRDGHADKGGGLWNDEKLTLTTVPFRANSACDNGGSGCNGGGMYNTSSCPALTDITLVTKEQGCCATMICTASIPDGVGRVKPRFLLLAVIG